jgi:hypothetical protein
LWAHAWRLIPEAYAAGLMQFHARSIDRPAYLMGTAGDASVMYFPIALAVKSTASGVLIVMAALAVMCRRALSGRAETAWWIATIPAGLYFAVACLGGMNLGVRHVLPTWTVALGVGAAAVTVACGGHRWRSVLVGLLILISVIESAAWSGSRIGFFNRVALAIAPKAFWLADSNLDWGQDLPALRRWRLANPDGPLLLSYFGTADPSAYGLRYENFPPGYPFASTLDALQTLVERHPDGFVVMSLTWLQGVYRPDLEPTLRKLRAIDRASRIGESLWVAPADAVRAALVEPTGKRSSM